MIVLPADYPVLVVIASIYTVD